VNAIEAWTWLNEVGATVQFKCEKDGVKGVSVVVSEGPGRSVEVWRPTLLEAVIVAQEYNRPAKRSCSHCGHTK
jgi:hypothetical protein